MLIDTNLDKIEDMKPIQEREITIKFNADTSPRLRWKFKPQQNEIKVDNDTPLIVSSSAHFRWFLVKQL